ncbi:MAG: DUF1329 domain-containing protein [Pseudomonadota bacterium]
MKGKGLTQKTIGTLTALALLLMILPVMAQAQIMGPSTYTAEELAKVREWEKTWAGKKIDKSNIDQVAAYMPESYVGLYKSPDQWGAPPEGLWFNIVAYEEVKETKGMIAATQKYSGTVKKNADGTIANYAEIAGRPFPNPKDGFEIAYNYEFNNHGDTYKYRRFSPNINPKSRTERPADQEYTEFYFIHRTEIEPMPAVPDNPKGAHRGYFMNMLLPPEFVNTRIYSLRFIDPAKEDDSYLWYNQFRRIRRMSTAQRTDSIDGSDIIYDDEYFWDGQLIRNTYTAKGKRDILCSRHTDLKKATRQVGQGIMNGITLERCNTLVVDVVSKDKNYLYGKRVWYVDPESYNILWTEIYDQQGRFWKCFMQNTDVVTTAKGDAKHCIVGSQFEDFQRNHSGLSHQQYYYVPKVSEPQNPEIFTLGYLQKTY